MLWRLKEYRNSKKIKNNEHLEIINSLNYFHVKTLSIKQYKQVYKIRKGNKYFVIKFSSSSDNYFISAYCDILNNVSIDFQRLVIPAYIEHGYIDDTNHYIVIDWLDGKNFKRRWQSFGKSVFGGEKIKIYTIKLIFELIHDLLKIDTKPLILKGLRTITHQTAKTSLTLLIDRTFNKKMISKEQYDAANEITRTFADSIKNQPLIMSNSDFQFLNFIEISKHNTGVVDWDKPRATCYEKEHCIGFQWLLMWNNEKWRTDFLSKAKIEFNLDKDIFRGVILLHIFRIKLDPNKDEKFRQAIFNHLEIFLNNSRYDQIWEPN